MAELQKTSQKTNTLIRVTFFEDRAEVCRQAIIPIQKDGLWSAIEGITPFIDDRSVEVTIDKKDKAFAQVAGARVKRNVITPEVFAASEIAKRKDERREALQKQVKFEKQQQHLSIKLNRIRRYITEWIESLSFVPREMRKNVEAWQNSYQELLKNEKKALDALSHCEEKIMRVKADAERAQLRYQLWQKKSPKVVARIEFQVVPIEHIETNKTEGEQTESQNVTINIRYRTPMAMWRPEHLARLTFDEKSETKSETKNVKISTFATVWQQTGEVWADVPLFFSTARPTQIASPPMLQEDMLSLRYKTVQERKQIVIESHEQKIASVGVNDGTRSMDEMLGVDDGGVPLEFKATSFITIPSNGEPVRVPLSEHSFKAKVSRVLRAEYAPVAHVRALMTLQAKTPLLAGPIRIIRNNSMIGRTKLDFVSVGEAFELGFGRDDAIRARRMTDTNYDETMITGTQKIDKTIDLFLSNLSDEKKTLSVIERIPVSELEKLTVRLTKKGAFTLDKKEGFLRTNVTLAPNEHKNLHFSYQIKAPSKMVLPF